MTVRRLHKASHSSMLCEVMTTDWPLALTSSNTPHKKRLEAGSTPVEGCCKAVSG